MAGDRIEGRDIYSTQGWVARKDEEIHKTVRDAGAAACVDDAILHTSIVLPHEDAARLGAFLLDAAKADIVGAARRVKEAHQRYKEAEEATHAWAAYEKAAADRHDALDALASELAKLDAMVGHDMSEATREK